MGSMFDPSVVAFGTAVIGFATALTSLVRLILEKRLHPSQKKKIGFFSTVRVLYA